jgi:AraC-like DNA-binding protein
MLEQPTTMRFSLKGTPKRQRLAVAKEVVGRAMMNMDFTPLTGAPEMDVELRLLPGVVISNARLSPYRSIAGYDPSRRNDDFILLWADSPIKGSIRQLGKERQADGTAVLLSSADRSEGEIHETISQTFLSLQRLLLLPLLPDAEAAFMRPISADNEALRLLGIYLGGLRTLGDAHAQPAFAQMAATHLADLVALAVGANRDAAQQAGERGLRAARLAAVKRWTLARLGSPELNVNAAAAAIGVSPRTVQLLFEAEGMTFSQYVLRERLALAHHRLSMPLLARCSITDIAYGCGFGDLSYFTQSFRRAYGQTPSDARRAALADGRS